MRALGGRTIIVTGAAGGMGRVIVPSLLEAGANVVAVDLKGEPLAAVQAENAARASSLRCVTADLTQESSAGEVVDQARSAFGGLYALLNLAGITLNLAIGTSFSHRDRPKFWQIEPRTWSLLMEVNAGAVFRLSRAAAPMLIEAKRGRIINVTTSLWGTLNGGAPYGPSKSAAESLTYAIAADLRGTGVTANVLVPGGPTDTQQVPNNPSVPRSSLLRPDVMVAPLLWLLSDDAGAVTGRRFRACDWDPSLPAAAAAAYASAPVAWTALATDYRLPAGVSGPT